MPKTISGSTYIIRYWWSILEPTGIFFDPDFDYLDKPYFFQHCHFWHWFAPSTASTGLKSSCGPPSVLHKIVRLEQTNSHDMSEKFPPPDFMMKRPLFKKLNIYENCTASDIRVQSGFQHQHLVGQTFFRFVYRKAEKHSFLEHPRILP